MLIFRISILIIFIVFSYGQNVNSTELAVRVPDITVLNGDTITINFTVSDIYNLFGAGFDLEYNPNNIEYLNSIEGSFLNSNGEKPTIFIVTDDPVNGKIMAGLTRSRYSDGGASSVADTLLLQIRFIIKSSGTTPLNIIYSSLIAPDGTTKYPHSVVNGAIIAEDPTLVYDENQLIPNSHRIEIGDNFPNPFNSSTAIKCMVHVKGQVSVSIINILGQEVKAVYSGSLGTGEHTFAWDGMDKHNHLTSSGIYFMVFRFSEDVEIRKLVYLK